MALQLNLIFLLSLCISFKIKELKKTHIELCVSAPGKRKNSLLFVSYCYFHMTAWITQVRGPFEFWWVKHSRKKQSHFSFCLGEEQRPETLRSCSAFSLPSHTCNMLLGYSSPTVEPKGQSREHCNILRIIRQLIESTCVLIPWIDIP